MICPLCPHSCNLSKEGQHGLCRGRVFQDGKIIDENYGRITSLALDPIEKKPLRRFFPGSLILSIGSYGCNLKCPFCQNYEISQADMSIPYKEISPEEMVDIALNLKKEKDNIGLAFTYNEPLVSYEYVLNTARLAKQKGLITVLVSNGYINKEPLLNLIKYIDAANIDLKGFSKKFYQMCGGDLKTVKENLALIYNKTHLEVTNLIIPGENDSSEEMEELSSFLASLDKDIPLHITRFFPAYKMLNKDPTPKETILKHAKIANKHLNYVYPGNMF